MCLHVAAFVIPFNLINTMTTFRKVNFDLTHLSRGGGICRQTVCYHVAENVIPLNLICNMTIF